MKNSTISPQRLLLAMAIAVSAVSGRAQDVNEPPEPAEPSGWFVRADGAARFGLKATVKSVTTVKPAGFYDNGRVLPDISGRSSGLTWNWSYESPSQVSYDANNQPQAIQFQRLYNVPSTGTRDMDLSSPVFEGELVSGYHFDDFRLWKRKARVGIELGIGYFSTSHDMSFQASGDATRIINSFGLGGVVPPLPPYSGTFEGPGPLLDLNADPAASSTNVFLATTALDSSLDASFYNFRVGPSFGIDLTKRLNLEFSFGYDSVYADATFKYKETSLYHPNPTTVTVDEAQWRIGFYAELLLNWQLSQRLQLFLGGDFRHNSDLTFGDGHQQLTIGLGSTYAGKAGLSFAF